MGIKELEKSRLKEWFYKKHSYDCYYEAEKELKIRRESLGFWKRNILSKEDINWKRNRFIEILNKRWEDEVRDL